jgi:hypothetical protein
VIAVPARRFSSQFDQCSSATSWLHINDGRAKCNLQVADFALPLGGYVRAGLPPSAYNPRVEQEEFTLMFHV